MRIAFAFLASLLAGYLFWPYALRYNAYIVERDLFLPEFWLPAFALGMGLVLLAGRRGRILFWLWPWLFSAGAWLFLRQYPDGLSPVRAGTSPVFCILIGCVAGILWYDFLGKNRRPPNG